MAAFPREELEEMVRRWLEAVKRAEAENDWGKHLTPFFTDDAEYSWNVGPNEDFMARGHDQIRDWALGVEMAGLDGWTYPYQQVLIDEKRGEVVGFWKQVAPFKQPDGSNYEVAGIGGSWFRYAGNYHWCQQKDFFDIGNVAALLVELDQAGLLNDVLKEKIRKGAEGALMPGHVKHQG